MSRQEDSEKRMSLMGHFEELRGALVRCAWVFVLGFGIGYYLSDWVMAWLREPLFAALPEEMRKLYFTHLFENFLTHLKIAGYISLFVFSPYYFYEIWGFIAPGLKTTERKWVLPFLFAGGIFFVGGALFAYYVLFPVGFKYFVEFGGPTDTPLLTIDAYYSTCLKLMLVFGAGFELPVAICLLGILGLVHSTTLKAQRKNAILGITVLSALFAPPDAISMLLLMMPLIVLYEAALWVVVIFERKNPAKSVVEGPKAEKSDPLRGKSDY